MIEPPAMKIPHVATNIPHATTKTRCEWMNEWNLCSIVTNQWAILSHAEPHCKGTEQERTLFGQSETFQPRTEHWGCKRLGNATHHGREETSLSCKTSWLHSTGNADFLCHCHCLDTLRHPGYKFEASGKLLKG